MAACACPWDNIMPVDDKRDNIVPLGKRELHMGGLVVFLLSSMVVSVATADNITADYPAD